jgi:exodeoxyribonuclease-3
LNLNGIRSAASKGFEAWAEGVAADCMGVQEIKAQADTVVGRFDKVAGMHGHFHYADKKGYSGVGLYSRKAPSEVVLGIGNPEFDAEGRYVEARFDTPERRLSIISCYFPSGSSEFDAEGRYVELRYDTPARKLSFISCYFPSGSSGEERQQAKFRFLDEIDPHLRGLRAQREFILCGDVNIAHQQSDLKNWRSNQKNSGFLPEERAWMTKITAETGLVDVYRLLKPETTEECYTWWSNRGQAWAKNVGWRLDYHLATPGLAQLARSETIYKTERFSDHAPVTVEYELAL